MKQIWVPRAGPPRVLQVREGPDPVPRTGEVRVRVATCGVSMMDVLARAGMAPGVAEPPFVPGFEVAGTVDMVAQGARGLLEGDPVVALPPLGGYADLVCVPFRQVYRRQEWMSVEDGAALPFDYLTAYLALVVVGSLRKGSRVLIHAADSGPGLAALHICRILDAEAYGTAPADRHDFLENQGLQHAIDHTMTDYEVAGLDMTGGRGFEVIVNPYGGVHRQKNYRLLSAGGRLIHLAYNHAISDEPSRLASRFLNVLGKSSYTPEDLMNDNKGVIGLRLDRLWTDVETISRAMDQLLEWYDEALFRPCIDGTVSFDRAAEAHTHVQLERNEGKVLLRPPSG